MTLKLRTTTSSDVFPLKPSGSPAVDDDDETKSAPQATPPPFYIQVHASVKYSTHPALPVTLATWRTPLERRTKEPGQGSQEDDDDDEEDSPMTSPVWLESALTPLRSVTDPNKLAGPPQLGWIGCRRGGYPRDLRESWDFLTIPAADTHEEVVVRHLLPRDSLEFWSKAGGGREDAKPEKGEKFVVGPSARGLGTFWWCWGDLSQDLVGKKFYSDNWWDEEDEGEDGEDGDGNLTPAEDWVKSEGDEGFGLTMEVENDAEIEFV